MSADDSKEWSQRLRSTGGMQNAFVKDWSVKTSSPLACLLVLLGIAQGVCAPADHASEPTTDIRVLIDVSGSMKRNDPNNIRIPALKLLVGLLPDDTRSGVWLFATESTMLVPVANANAEWKKIALKSASGIHSHGQFTNIESALKAAAEDWEINGGDDKKNIILLTDGVVDVAKNPDLSRKSRESIFNRVIPKLQRLRAQVHTIALSDHADHDLLKKLSFDTGGWNQKVESARELERAFLGMFKKAVTRDSIPLSSNKFTIDPGIQEFSILVFREPGAEFTRLVDPDKTKLSQEDASESIRWLHEASYDLITVEQPKAGEWQLLADFDKDNQVMVVTDLKLEMNTLPNYIAESEAVQFSARITEKGEPVVHPDFLRMIDIRLEQADDLGRTRNWTFKSDPADIGNFKEVIKETLVPGKHRFKIVANGQTFQREMEHVIEVIGSAIKVETEAVQGPDGKSLQVRLIPDADIIDLLTVTAEASVTNNSDKEERFNMSQTSGAWEFVIAAPPAEQHTIINFSVSAKTLRGNTISPPIKPLLIDENFFASLDRKNQEMQPALEHDTGLIGEENEEENHDAPSTDNEPDWLMTVIIAGAANLILIVGGFFGYKTIQKRLALQRTQLIERLET